MDLFDVLKETLPGLPGFQSLSLFGSHAEGHADKYSDIDIVVRTNDLPNAKAQILRVLEQVSPVDFSWAINQYPDEWNNTIAFRNEGYYKRLDLGLAGISGTPRMMPSEQIVPMCDPRPVPAMKDSLAYVPKYGSMGHFLLGQFIGCLRYLKARKREQTMTCYRFASASAGWRLVLQYARLTGNTDFRTKLSTDDYAVMDRLLSTDDRLALLSDIDYSSPAAMDGLVRISMDGMLADGVYLAGMLGETIPAEVFERISDFVAEETARCNS